MQQGGFDGKKTLLDKFKDAFGDSTDLRDFFNVHNISIPASKNAVKERVMTNVDRFKFHYATFSCMILFIYVLYSPVFIILASIFIACLYAYKRRPVLFNVEMEPKSICVVGGVSTAIFIIFFKDAIVGFLAISALCCIATLTHAVALETSSGNDKEVV